MSGLMMDRFLADASRPALRLRPSERHAHAERPRAVATSSAVSSVLSIQTAEAYARRRGLDRAPDERERRGIRSGSRPSSRPSQQRRREQEQREEEQREQQQDEQQQRRQRRRRLQERAAAQQLATSSAVSSVISVDTAQGYARRRGLAVVPSRSTNAAHRDGAGQRGGRHALVGSALVSGGSSESANGRLAIIEETELALARRADLAGRRAELEQQRRWVQNEAAVVIQAVIRGWFVRAAVGHMRVKLFRSVVTSEKARLAKERLRLRVRGATLEREAAMNHARRELEEERRALQDERRRVELRKAELERREQLSRSPDLGAGWQEGYDQTSGKKFYYHSVTNETTWTLPPAVRPGAQHAAAIRPPRKEAGRSLQNAVAVRPPKKRDEEQPVAAVLLSPVSNLEARLAKKRLAIHQAGAGGGTSHVLPGGQPASPRLSARLAARLSARGGTSESGGRRAEPAGGSADADGRVGQLEAQLVAMQQQLQILGAAPASPGGSASNVAVLAAGLAPSPPALFMPAAMMAKVQARWRGVVARRKLEAQWLAEAAALSQLLGSGGGQPDGLHIACPVVSARGGAEHAAETIQRLWRGWRVRSRLSELLDLDMGLEDIKHYIGQGYMSAVS